MSEQCEHYCEKSQIIALLVARLGGHVTITADDWAETATLQLNVQAGTDSPNELHLRISERRPT